MNNETYKRYVKKKINDVGCLHSWCRRTKHITFSCAVLWCLGGYSHLFFNSIVCRVLFTVDYTHIMMSSQKKIIRVWPLHTSTTYVQIFSLVLYYRYIAPNNRSNKWDIKIKGFRYGEWNLKKWNHINICNNDKQLSLI